MAKEGIQIYRIGRIIVGLYVLQVVAVVALLALDQARYDLKEDYITKWKTGVHLELHRGSDFTTALIPGYGLYDRLRWHLGVRVDDGQVAWYDIDSPAEMPLDKVDITETRDNLLVCGPNGVEIEVDKTAD